MLVHKPLGNVCFLFEKFKSINFYIHVDAKMDLKSISQSCYGFKNVFFLEERFDVKWAGFSMVKAMLNLINFAFQHDDMNEYFHLISGDDVLLNDNLCWNNDTIYMDFRLAEENRYRMRFNSIFADTIYQRSKVSKIFTQVIKFFDKFTVSQKKYYIGSQWFSIRREQLSLMINSITQTDIIFFEKKLCPDEHFFQYLVEKNHLQGKLSKDNRRFIVFDKKYQYGSSPVFLSLDQILNAQKEGFWFARKVDQSTMKEFYNLKSFF